MGHFEGAAPYLVRCHVAQQWVKDRMALLREVVGRVASVAHPDRIVLFGSSARGEARARSDIDLLVVVPDTADRRELLELIHRHLHGVDVPVDVVVVSRRDVEVYRDDPGMIVRRELREGQTVYPVPVTEAAAGTA